MYIFVYSHRSTVFPAESDGKMYNKTAAGGSTDGCIWMHKPDCSYPYARPEWQCGDSTPLSGHYMLCIRPEQTEKLIK